VRRPSALRPRALDRRELGFGRALSGEERVGETFDLNYKGDRRLPERARPLSFEYTAELSQLHSAQDDNGEILKMELKQSLPEAVRAYEAELIMRALEASGWRLTEAAQQLGVKHQTLSAILHRRHTQFLTMLRPRKRRRASILRSLPEHG
jgi:DNA-binding NtrC family response regulator